MTSRFVGRDYNTLRTEIINFLKARFPQDWDWTDLSDPMVILAESLARVGDQLHYTIDELRRECDMATAKRSSSIYSYAMREGYKMMLPRGASGTLLVNSSKYEYEKEGQVLEKDMAGNLHLKINKFDPIDVTTTGDVLYAANDVDADLYASPSDSLSSIPSIDNRKAITDYASYVETIYNKTQRINVVLGNYAEFNFTYHDINTDSTVELPDPLIDRNLLSLEVSVPDASAPGGKTVTEWSYTEDIIGSGFYGNIYTLTPKFIGGAITLCIEFPTNKSQLFTDQGTTFKFKYIRVSDRKIDATPENNKAVDLSDYISFASGYEAEDDKEKDAYLVDLGEGVKGFSEYEDANLTRENYKKYTQDYSSLLTKDDYINYIKATKTTSCNVYDHADMYKQDVLPAEASLIPRVVYVVTDGNYNTRKDLWSDLKERSSRSDCIVMMPYGKDPYTIFVKAECYLLGTSVSEITTKIKTELLKYYSDALGDKIPDSSMINYLVHKASDKVVRMDNLIVRDSTFGTVNSDFNNVNNYSNEQVDALFNAIQVGDYSNYTDPNGNYSLKGDIEGNTYNKYPLINYKEPDNGTPSLPINGQHPFPDIYYHGDDKLTDYEDIINYQIIYGELDSASYDEEPIFSDSPEAEYGLPLNTEYVEHHYVVPFLNRVVILVKAISTQ